MSIKLLHLRNNLELLGNPISLPKNYFFIGGPFLNLEKSLLYKELASNQYKQWLWSEIKAKTLVYQQLIQIKNSITAGNDVILACSCDKKNNCNGEVLKKAVLYLLEQERLSAKDAQPTSFADYAKAFSFSTEHLHDFAFWLASNSYYEENLNFHYLWISFLSQR